MKRLRESLVTAAVLLAWLFVGLRVDSDLQARQRPLAPQLDLPTTSMPTMAAPTFNEEHR